MPITREEAQDFEDAHAEGLHDDVPREGCPICESYRTKTGRMMSENEIRKLSTEAEQGHEFHHRIDQEWEDWSRIEGPRFFTD